MKRSEAAKLVKSRYAEYLPPAKKKIHGKQTYICPLCGNGTGKDGDGMSIDPHGDGTQLKCFKCGFYGDIVDLYQQEHNCDAKTAFDAFYKLFGIDIDAGDNRTRAEATETATEPRKAAQGTNIIPAQKKPVETPTEAAESKADYREYYKHCKAHITDDAARAYLSFRGISPETAAAYWLGYDPASGYLIIPAASSYYVARNTDPQGAIRYKNPTGASIELFNKNALYNEAGRPVFVTEGAIDALSIIEAGGEAVALNSTSNTRKLLETLKEKRPRSVLILALDNDPEKKDERGREVGKAGQRATAALAEGLKELEIPFLQADICGQHKDPNEALTADKVGFTAAVTKAERAAIDEQAEQPIKAASASEYLSGGMFEKDIDYFRQYKDRKLGIHPDIDRYLTLYPGLAALGGASSLGKTTFAVNIIDRLLDNGETVLYFSLEQLPIEIITKSLARKLYEADPTTQLTNIDIKNGATCETLERIKREYAEKATRYQIITGSFRTTAADIVAFVEEYRREHGGDSCKPIVIIDYLQLIAPPVGFKGGIREYTDENVKTLKDMQKRNGLFVIMISSFNRSSNYEPVSYEAFKETSMIEFTCDYVWGLQLSILDAENDDFYTVKGKQGGRKERPIDQKRRLVNDAQGATPKKVEFVSLKSRNGKQFYKAFFDYRPQFDSYTEDADKGESMKGFTRVFGSTPFDDDESDDVPTL